MKDPSVFFPQDFYENYLTDINGKYFTRREIDVIACILHIRNTQKSADFLSIESVTFYKHVSNIMDKTDLHSQERIIDFVLASGKQALLTTHYALLIKEMPFEKEIKKVSKLVDDKNSLSASRYLIQAEENTFVKRLKHHLDLSGFFVRIGTQPKWDDFIFFDLHTSCNGVETLDYLQKIKKNKVLILNRMQGNCNEVSKALQTLDHVDFSNEENYYLSFFALLKNILPHLDLEKIRTDFQKQCEKPPTTFPWTKNASEETIQAHTPFSINFFKFPSPRSFLKIFQPLTRAYYFVPALCISGVFFFFHFLLSQGRTPEPIRSEISLPKEDILLQRPDVLQKINDKFQAGQKIQAVALVGQGGSGKTTLARQYAQKQNTSCLWEINAESQASLLSSFEKLARTLAKTDADQKLLQTMFNTKDSPEKEEIVLRFVKERLKAQPNWFLIWDNVEQFADIQKYFPKDVETWGYGKIILTTRDSNIENNSYVNHTVFIDDLTPQQKINLYTNIMKCDGSTTLTKAQTEELEYFLTKIPPFPLDVSVAACYLKTTKDNYDSYIKKISQHNKDLLNLEKSLLKQMGEYTKTRYGLVATAVQNIIATHQDYQDLLLFTVLFNAHNIPRDLLDCFKNTSVVDHFIFNLKKHSLITNHIYDTFSIHRDINRLILMYLKKELNLQTNKSSILPIVETLERYLDSIIRRENISQMKDIIFICEMFLSHKEILTENMEGMIKSKLGVLHFFVGNDIQARDCLEESLSKLKNSCEENGTRIAFALGYLGNVERDMGNYEKAKLLLEKSIAIYEKSTTKDHLRHAYFLVYLSIIETYLGNYEAANTLLEKSLMIQKDWLPENTNFHAWVSGRQAILERIFGNYEKAEALLETILEFFKKENSLLDIAWASQHLGVIYIKLKKYEKAKYALIESLKFWISLFPDEVGPDWVSIIIDPQDDPKKLEKAELLFENLSKIYDAHFHETYVEAAWHIGQLGILYKEMGNYKKALTLLNFHKTIVEKNLGHNNLSTALILNNIGEIHLLQNQLEEAENFLQQSLLILGNSNHPNEYQCLENLAKLYSKKALNAKENGEEENSKEFQKKASTYLTRALNVITKHFPPNSHHEKRLQAELATIKQ